MRGLGTRSSECKTCWNQNSESARQRAPKQNEALSQCELKFLWDSSDVRFPCLPLCSFRNVAKKICTIENVQIFRKNRFQPNFRRGQNSFLKTVRPGKENFVLRLQNPYMCTAITMRCWQIKSVWSFRENLRARKSHSTTARRLRIEHFRGGCPQKDIMQLIKCSQCYSDEFSSVLLFHFVFWSVHPVTRNPILDISTSPICKLLLWHCVCHMQGQNREETSHQLAHSLCLKKLSAVLLECSRQQTPDGIPARDTWVYLCRAGNQAQRGVSYSWAPWPHFFRNTLSNTNVKTSKQVQGLETRPRLLSPKA